MLYSVRSKDGVIVLAINDVERGTTSLWPKISVTVNSASRTDVGRCFFNCVPKRVNPLEDQAGPVFADNGRFGGTS